MNQLNPTKSVQPLNPAQILAGSHRPDFDVIARWIPQGAHVLDLGCGDGTLLHKLIRERAVTGYGVEKNDANVAACVAKGLPVLQQDLESGLAWFENDSFDVAVLSLTLQAVHQTEKILTEMLRVASEAVVSFPNFAYRTNREAIANGHVPVSEDLPYEWYESPNVRFFTIADFEALCDKLGIEIRERRAFDEAGEAVTDDPNLNGSLAFYRLGRTP